MKFSLKTILFVFVMIILAYAIYMAYVDIKKNLPKDGSKDLSEHYGEPKLKICLYKATWCGHCTSYLKSNVFDDTYNSIKGKYKDVVFVTYDFDANKQLAEKYNIESFPSIIAIDSNGKLLDTFDGDRYKKDDLIKFVEQNRLKAT